MVREYAFSSGDAKLSDNFMLHEAKCPDSDLVLVSEELVVKVEQLRAAVPNCATIEISSGYRTPQYSVSVGGSAKDQHTQGNAWDLACFDGGHNIIDGKLVSCVAQDLGFNGIGYMGNYVHVDVGNRHWFGDEQTGKNIPNDDFYTYFGIAKPEQPQPGPTQENVDVFYQVYANDGALPEVQNCQDIDGNGYAGYDNVTPSRGLKVRLSKGNVFYQAHILGRAPDVWNDEVANDSDWAGRGDFSEDIDGIKIRLEGLDDYDVFIRVARCGGEYYSWVKNQEDFAGVYGQAIARVQIYVAHK